MAIPQSAQKVFTGQIFNVYQWEQELYDGSTATFEMLERPDTVEVLATDGQLICYGLQSQPMKENYVGLFGGRVDAGEEPLAAAKRELREESGLESDDWELYKTYRPYNKIDWEVHVYIARNCHHATDPSPDAGEKITMKQASFEEFLDVMESGRYMGKELLLDVLRMRLHPEQLAAFRARLFPPTV